MSSIKTSCTCTLHYLLLLILVNNYARDTSALGNLEDGVQLYVQDNHVVMDYGLVQVNISNPSGLVTGVQYNGIDNLLEILNEEQNRGYWDLYWTQRGNKGTQFVIEGTSFKVIVQNETQVEISFTRTWNSSASSSSSNPSNSNSADGLPLNFDIRCVMLKGSSGFYTYGIYEHLNGWPDFNLNTTLVAFKLRKEGISKLLRFQYAAISKTRQRRMPLPEDREPPRGKLLQFKEASLLVDPVEAELKGQVDDKYMYAQNNEDIKVHGWVSSDPLVGFRHITASDEYRGGGLLKQDLTSPHMLVFLSSHYMGQDKIPMFGNGEPWKKVYGPVFLYLNTAPHCTNESVLWDDANEQIQQEAQKWPYNFLASTDYPKSDQRGTVHGKLLVRDRFVSKEDVPAVDEYVGLALPGEVGSWQTECKGYQFWTRAGPDGSFTIKNVHCDSIEVDDDLVYEPPRNGITLWEIGIPDRTAAEFFIPYVDHKYVNPLYLTQDRFRQKLGDDKYNSTTWQIKFNLDSVDQGTIYKLRVALASTTRAELQIRLNYLNTEIPHFTTGGMYKDNAIARYGIHGLYLLFNVDVKSDWLQDGENTIFLSQVRGEGRFKGVMYDYIRLEAPADDERTNAEARLYREPTNYSTANLINSPM
ncbi:hypothetical protein MKW98_020874 [Papaver atlanticum]|uniref:Rhamnogalacturonan endolyase n=1 Tax=Papaver atlanticum TaxID=357466 RepID=A0AAD4TDF6_9MAGN|nr:hypothetical protein MKW98_020874 [Papaver atlanticum]